jgi:hypothetical protein
VDFDPQRRFEILRRRQIVADRYLRGQTQFAIAQSLEVSQQTVSSDVVAIRKEWRKSALIDFDAKQDRELAKIDALEREYWDAWERSKTEKQHTRTRKRTGKAAGDEAEVRKEPRDGNPKFLEGVRQCIYLRCRILGFIKEKIEDQPPLGATVNVQQNFNLAVLTDEQLEQFERIRIAIAGGDPPREVSA